MPLPGLERDISSCTHCSHRSAPPGPSPAMQSCAVRQYDCSPPLGQEPRGDTAEFSTAGHLRAQPSSEDNHYGLSKRLDRRERYCELAAQRLSQEVFQFAPEEPPCSLDLISAPSRWNKSRRRTAACRMRRNAEIACTGRKLVRNY